MDFPSDLVSGRDENDNADVRKKILATLGTNDPEWLSHRQLVERIGGQHSDVIERTIIDLRDAGVIDARVEGGDAWVRIHVEPEPPDADIRPLRHTGARPGIRHDDLEAWFDDDDEPDDCA